MKQAKYQYIVDDILTQMTDNSLRPGDKLPSQRVLAQQYRVNRSTIIEAFDILESYGAIDRIEKRGVYVSQYKWNQYVKDNIRWHDYFGHSRSQNNQYYIRKINELEFDTHLIRTGTGELAPELIPNDLFKEIIAQDVEGALTTNYEPPKGKLALRHAVVEHLARKGISCNVEQICIVSGALQGLKLIADGLLVPQSKVLIETPSYINSVHTWHSMKAKMLPIQIETIEQHINHIFRANSEYKHSIFYCIPTLHNPTQHTYSKTQKQKIINQCQQQGIPIVEDDVYGDLWFEGDRPLPMKALDNNDNVLYLGSLSKTVSPGLRVGWIVGDERVISHLADLKMQNDYGASSIAQFIAQKWLTEPKYYHNHLIQLRQRLQRKSAHFIQCLETYLADCGTWQQPQGSFYIWFQLTVPIDMKTLFNQALEQGLIIYPGEIYDNEAKQYLRFSYAYIAEQDMEPAIQCLAELIMQHQH